MENSYEKGLAIHSAPSFALGIAAGGTGQLVSLPRSQLKGAGSRSIGALLVLEDEVGFEPTVLGFAGRCLTAWLLVLVPLAHRRPTLDLVCEDHYPGNFLDRFPFLAAQGL